MGFGQVLWSLLIIFFMVMFFMVFFMVVMDLFADKGLGGGKKAVWIIFLLIFPPITVLVYLNAQKAYIQNAVGSVSSADQIASAKALLDAGTISQDEFDQLKAKALASS